MIVKCAAYLEGRRVAEIALGEVSEVLRQPRQFVWIGLHEPSEETLREAQHEFGLHELAIEGAHCAHQRPKIESYGETMSIVLRTAQMNGQHIEFGETHFFVGANFLRKTSDGGRMKSHLPGFFVAAFPGQRKPSLGVFTGGASAVAGRKKLGVNGLLGAQRARAFAVALELGGAGEVLFLRRHGSAFF